MRSAVTRPAFSEGNGQRAERHGDAGSGEDLFAFVLGDGSNRELHLSWGRENRRFDSIRNWRFDARQGTKCTLSGREKRYTEIAKSIYIRGIDPCTVIDASAKINRLESTRMMRLHRGSGAS